MRGLDDAVHVRLGTVQLVRDRRGAAQPGPGARDQGALDSAEQRGWRQVKPAEQVAEPGRKQRAALRAQRRAELLQLLEIDRQPRLDVQRRKQQQVEEGVV